MCVACVWICLFPSLCFQFLFSLCPLFPVSTVQLFWLSSLHVPLYNYYLFCIIFSLFLLLLSTIIGTDAILFKRPVLARPLGFRIVFHCVSVFIYKTLHYSIWRNNRTRQFYVILIKVILQLNVCEYDLHFLSHFPFNHMWLMISLASLHCLYQCVCNFLFSDDFIPQINLRNLSSCSYSLSFSASLVPLPCPLLPITRRFYLATISLTQSLWHNGTSWRGRRGEKRV